jgi:hypothetical protein
MYKNTQHNNSQYNSKHYETKHHMSSKTIPTITPPPPYEWHSGERES